MEKQLLDFPSFSKKSQNLLKQFTYLQGNLHIPMLNLNSASEWVCQQKARKLNNTMHEITLNEAISKLEAAITAENASIKELKKLSGVFKKRIGQETSPLEQCASMEKNIDGIQLKLVIFIQTGLVPLLID
jgi:hypothetical protein